MVVTGDVAELFGMAGMNAVSIVQDQPRFEWASMMLFNCGACRILTPEYVDDEKNKLFDFEWAPHVGDLPRKWNQILGYEQGNEASLYHFTQGLPCFFETRGLPEDAVWDEEKRAMLHSVGWRELMGSSIHREPVLRRLLSRYA
jgi:hypothetical protein